MNLFKNELVLSVEFFFLSIIIFSPKRRTSITSGQTETRESLSLLTRRKEKESIDLLARPHHPRPLPRHPTPLPLPHQRMRKYPTSRSPSPLRRGWSVSRSSWRGRVWSVRFSMISLRSCGKRRTSSSPEWCACNSQYYFPVSCWLNNFLTYSLIISRLFFWSLLWYL